MNDNKAWSGRFAEPVAELVKTLEPGVYTAQLSGVGRTTGVGLAEIYEAP